MGGELKKTQDIIELASALRIPVAAIATPDSVSTVDHFVERGVFAKAPDGAVHPRVPYRSPAIATKAPMPAPALGADSGRICLGDNAIRPAGGGYESIGSRSRSPTSGSWI